jgi:tetratricopeptide (TPR) repeat protein
VHLSAGPIGKLNIPADIKEVSPQIKIVSNLIEWILPSNVITVSGYLEKPGNRGAGLTLSMVMSQTGDILGSITIWQKDYDPTATQSSVKDNDPVPYYCLAKPAAIWALFQLNATSKIKRGKFYRIYYGIKKLLGNVEDPEKFTPQGTDDWQSYAYFLAGVHWELEGKMDKARQLYVDAQNQDMNNYGALFNLGYLDIEDKNLERAIERLSKAKEMVEKSEKSEKFHRDVVWYVATYQLAAAYHYKSILLRAEEDIDKAIKCLEKAEDESGNLVETIDTTIKGLQNKSMEEKEKQLKKYLESIEPNANIMYSSILVDSAYQGPVDQRQSKIEKAKLKIKSIENIYSKLTPRVRYNLVCYYSIFGDKTKDTKAYKTALNHLEYALERGGDIIQWAQKDPSLEGVRVHEFKEFDEIVKKYAPKEIQDSADLPLAGLAIIRETYAKQLKEQGIISQCDLVLKADTPQAQEALAKNLGVSTTLLRRWAHIADLMRVVGDTQYVNLLEAADVVSLDALKKMSDPCELANLLKQVNQAQSLVKQLPSLETVQQWVQDAKMTKPKVL